MAWTGAILECGPGQLQCLCVPQGDFSHELHAYGLQSWNVLFAVNGSNHDEVQAIVYAVACAANAWNPNGPIPVPIAGAAQSDYVYAYFDHGNPGWAQCFYVGKGRGTRWMQHIDEAHKTPATQRTAKAQRIWHWVANNGLTNQRPAAMRAAASGTLVRKLYHFHGPYSAAQAFYVEYFLITHCLGTHSIANDTNGNADQGNCTAIARPKHLDQAIPKHVAVWDHTVCAFKLDPQTPSLEHTWRPASITMLAEPYAAALDVCLQGIVVPNAMAGQGRLPDHLMPRPNMQVTGASDCTLWYSPLQHPHYRLELRFGATQFLTTINLRSSGTGRNHDRAFIAYLHGCVIANAVVGNAVTDAAPLANLYGGSRYVKDPDTGRPYFKPFALNAEGPRAVWFDIANPHNPASGATNWIVGHNFHLSLVQAIELIVHAFN